MGSGPIWRPEEKALFEAHHERLDAVEMSGLLADHGYARTPNACRVRACKSCADKRRESGRRPARNRLDPDEQARLDAFGALALAGMREARSRGLAVAARDVVEAVFDLARCQPDVLEEIIQRRRRSA